MEDIICAISTPIGRGAISVVRMSGQGCLQKAEEFFRLKIWTIIPLCRG